MSYEPSPATQLMGQGYTTLNRNPCKISVDRMHLHSSSILAMCVVGAVACATPTEPAETTAVPITRFGPTGRALTAVSGYPEPQRFVVRDSATMAMVWQTIYKTVSPRPDMPLVDFNKNMVLVAALGTRSTAGHDIVLESAEFGAEGLIVYTRISAPPPGLAVAQVITQPVDVGVVPLSTGPVRFVDRF
jgi:hypothetical protein